MSSLLKHLSVSDPSPLRYEPIPLEALPGWEDEEESDAWETWQHTCNFFYQYPHYVARFFLDPEAWIRLFQKTYGMDQDRNNFSFKTYLLDHFSAFKISSSTSMKAHFTGYFEPIVTGTRTPHGTSVPIYARPPDLVILEDLSQFRSFLPNIRIAGRQEEGMLMPYYTRQEIDQGALAHQGLELVWVDDRRDAYFLHIQGSGTIKLPDGTSYALGYDGTNGHAYTSIGRALVEEGHVKEEEISMKAIYAWLDRNPDQTLSLFAKNQSYVFFKKRTSPHPMGALGVPLMPYRSLAVDPKYIPLGTPLWRGKEKRLVSGKRFSIAHDIGSAIKGPLRCDLYCGQGREAGNMAGDLNHPMELYLLQPRSVKRGG